MTDILPPAGWLNVRQLETNEFATGGANGNMNEQAKSLAARSELLKKYAALPYESKTGGYALNERVQLATGDIVRSTIPSNVNNPNENMTGWVKENSASQIFDESGKSQQSLNNTLKSKYVSADDYESIRYALDAISLSNATLLLESGRVYTLDNSTSTQFFSQIESIGKPATVIISAATKLSTFEKDLKLRNLNIIVLGKRVGVNDSSTSASFLYDFTMPSIDTLDIQDVNVYALTNPEDLSSFVDDVGKTRCAGFINVKINKRSRLNNINHYGFAKFANIEPTTSGAIHDENSVIGYNCETNLYFRGSSIVWEQGSDKNIGIKNTATNKTYWTGQSVGVSTNGKDSLMIEAEHNSPVYLENIWAEYAIEKSLYNQSKQSRVFNIFDKNSLQVGQTKHSKSDMDGDVIFSGTRAENPENLTGLLDVNGYSSYTHTDIEIKNTVKKKARVFVIRNLNECVISRVILENLGTIVTANGDKPINKITFSDMLLNDCYNADAPGFFWRFQPGVATYLIGEFNVINVSNSISPSVTASILHASVFDFDNVGVVNIKDSNFYCKTQPIKSFPENTAINVSNTTFSILSINNCYNTLNTLNIAANNFKASKFDMILNITPVDTIIKFVKMKLSKSLDTGLVYCYPHWKTIDVDATVASVSSTNIIPIASTDSFKLVASSGSSRIEIIIDMATKTNSVISNIGSVFSSTKADNKICLSVDSSSRLNLDVGNSLTWTQGVNDIRISLIK